MEATSVASSCDYITKLKAALLQAAKWDLGWLINLGIGHGDAHVLHCIINGGKVNGETKGKVN